MLYSINKFLKLEFGDRYEKAIKYKYKFISKYCENISIEYLKYMCNDKNNKIYLYSINDILTTNYKNEIVGVVVIRKILDTVNTTRIYIPLISVHKDMRNYGYGEIIVEEIIKKHSKNKILELVLLSLKTSYNFYEKIGFIKSNVKFIEKNENIEDCIMMTKRIII